MFQPDRKATGPMPPQPGSTTAPPQDAVRAAEPCVAAAAAGAQPAIDLAHLDRMTFGEENLAREVLRLFGRQADTLFAHIQRARPNAAAPPPHTLQVFN